MIVTIGLCLVSAIAGSVGTYFFLRNNPQKAAAINSAVATASAAEKSVVSTLSK